MTQSDSCGDVVSKYHSVLSAAERNELRPFDSRVDRLQEAIDLYLQTIEAPCFLRAKLFTDIQFGNMRIP